VVDLGGCLLSLSEKGFLCFQRTKMNFGRGEWVVDWEVDLYFEYTSFVGCIRLERPLLNNRENGKLTGPSMKASQLNMSSPTGPAFTPSSGVCWINVRSFIILLCAILCDDDDANLICLVSEWFYFFFLFLFDDHLCTIDFGTKD